MRKLFLLIPALALTLLANATSTTISPESATSDNNIRAAFNGTADTIYLNPGEYIQVNQIHFRRSAVLIAANKNDKPVIRLKHYIDHMYENTKIFVDGVIFDGSATTERGIRPHDATTGKELHFNDCEFINFTHTVISGDEDGKVLDSCVINNCKFYNNNRSCIFMQNANLVGVKVTNSTFANITSVSGGDYASPIDVRSASAKVLVDHCTMYNCATIDANYNYINVASTSDVVVSNSIFASAEEYDCCGTYLKAGGSVTNCLTYNLKNWQGTNNYGHVKPEGVSITDCVKANPLFKDAANKDFSLYASSPARGAGDDGSDLGDPRWYKALAPVAIPATLVPFDALLSENAGVIVATPDSIDFKATGSREFTDIEWAKWKVTAAKDGLYNFVAHAYRPDGNSQKFEIVLLNSDESQEIRSREDQGMSKDDTIQIDKVTLEAGKTYVLKVRNLYNWSKSKLLDVQVTYDGGTIITVPDTLWPIDALRSEHAQLIHGTVDTLTFARLDHEWEADDAEYTVDGSEYVKWNINLAKDGKYQFTANTYCTQGHNYRIILLNENETATIGTWLEKDNIAEYDYHQNVDWKFGTPVLDLTKGKYVIKMQSREKGRVMYVATEYLGGAVTALPGQLLGEDALLEKTNEGSKYMKRNEDGALESSNNKYPATEYAIWNVSFAAAGTYTVTLNLDAEKNSGHNYRVELYEGDNLVGYAEELASTELDASVGTKGDNILDQTIEVSVAGNYTVKLINRRQWSSMILHGITFAEYIAPAAVTMNEADENNNAWSAYVGGEAVNITMNRTIKGGMYNAICLPFALSGDQVRTAFGSDAKWYYLDNASIANEVLNLQFAEASDIFPGTPYLIQTSSELTNLSFTGVSIALATAEGSSTYHSGWPVSFKGSFVAQQISAGTNNLLLYADNKVGFPSTDKTLNGFRAYFHIENPSNMPIFKTARIVTPHGSTTAFELIETQSNGTIKTIENGQIIIIRDGVHYNVMGARVK